MELSLRAMSPSAVIDFTARSSREYVADLVRSGMPEQEARANADSGITASFADGVAINGNEIFDVLDGDDRVGLLWLAPLWPGTWFVMEIEIAEPFRRRGYGRATMLLAEEVAREHGAGFLGLNVFGHNPNARALYESLGYEVESVRMRKPLH